MDSEVAGLLFPHPADGHQRVYDNSHPSHACPEELSRSSRRISKGETNTTWSNGRTTPTLEGVTQFE